MLRRLLVCLWLCPAALSVAASDEGAADRLRAQIFLEVFKHPPPGIPVDSYVRIVVDGAATQKVRAVLLPGDGRVLLDGKAIVGLLAPSVRTAILQQLEQKIDASGWLTRAALDEAGLKTAFAVRKFEFSIETTAVAREKRVRYLDAPLVDPFTVDAVRPAPVSAFLNFNVKAASRTETMGNLTQRPSAVAFATDGAINLRGVVLEGAAYGQSDAARLAQRGDVRLVYDRPREALRFTAGDLNYPVFGYQTLLPIGGLGFAKDFSLQPHIRPYRTGQFDFYLDRPAEVKVWVNNSLVKTLQLPAGAHDIRGLTPAIGQNDMRLMIEDSAGRRELLHFSFIFNPVLLDRDRSVFSYNAGFLRTVKNGRYVYDPDKPVLSGSYLRGVTDDTTLGGYAQADRSQGLLGLRALHLVSLGTLQLDAATSRTPENRWDVGARVELTHAPASRDSSAVQSQVFAEFLGRHFAPLGALTRAPRDALNFGASLSVPLDRRTTGQLSGSVTAARSLHAVDAHAAAATVTRRWGRFVTGSLSLRHSRSSRNERETQVLVGLTISFARGASTFYAAKELESDAVAMRWDSGRPSNFSTPYGFASTRVGDGNEEYVGGAGYWGNAGLVELSHTRLRTEMDTGHLARDETAVRLQSALVFAGSRFAFTRPIAENFAIVTGQEGLAHTAMKLDPDGVGGSRARSSWIGPAVLGDLPSYRLRDLRVEPVNPPIGATPEKLTYALAPAYKSGILLRLGKELRVIAVGRLTDDRGQALSNLPLEIRRLDAREERPVTTFTSRSGQFQVSDAKPGRYEIRPADDTRWRGVIVEIGEAPEGLFRLGTITLPGGA